MSERQLTAETLWDRYAASRSNECRQALVDHYTPVVQMQTAVWAYGNSFPVEEMEAGSDFDGLAEPAEEVFFLPYVPPAQR